MSKILFITYQNIFGKVNTGGIQVAKRNFDLISSVTKQKIYIALICEQDYAKPDDSKIKYFERTANNKQALISALLLRKIYKIKEEKRLLTYIVQVNPDIIFLDGSMIGILLSKVPRNIKSLVYFHNVERDYAWNKVKKEGLCFLPSFFASLYNEKIAVKKATKIISINERDGHRLEKLYGRLPDLYLPVSFYDRFKIQKIRRSLDRKELLFIGMMFPPNYQGIEWFIKEVMSELPEYHLTIVGKNFEKGRRRLERNNVTVIGTVDDLDEYYYTYPVIVMPIQYGAGMKVKTAEAMMYGMTIVATDEALEGYHVEGIQGIYRCNTADEFIKAIREIYEHDNLKVLQEDVRQIFLEEFETGSHAEKVGRLLEDI